VRRVDLRALSYFVAVVDERNFGRAAARLHMTQPPLTRAVRALEDELGTELLVRTRTGAEPTTAGTELHARARRLLRDADAIRPAVAAAAGARVVRIGTLADTTDHVPPEVLTAFHEHHPHTELRVREYDLTDPSAGLRSGETDVAITRLPFDTAGLLVHPLAEERVGVLARSADPLGGPGTGARSGTGTDRREARLGDLHDRRWVRLQSDIDPDWLAYWTGGPSAPADPAVRTVQDCVQAVLLEDRLALAPVGQRLPDGLRVVPTADRPASVIAAVWSPGADAATRAFVAAMVASAEAARSLLTR
jgi:DNA-binding transcriptional LysR family regulator